MKKSAVNCYKEEIGLLIDNIKSMIKAYKAVWQRSRSMKNLADLPHFLLPVSPDMCLEDVSVILMKLGAFVSVEPATADRFYGVRVVIDPFHHSWTKIPMDASTAIVDSYTKAINSMLETGGNYIKMSFYPGYPNVMTPTPSGLSLHRFAPQSDTEIQSVLSQNKFIAKELIKLLQKDGWTAIWSEISERKAEIGMSSVTKYGFRIDME